MTPSLVLLPLFSDTYYKYSVTLESKQFTVVLKQNQRAKAYIMDLYDVNGLPVFQGQKLVPSTNITGGSSLSAKGLTGYFYLAPLQDNVVYEDVLDNLDSYYAFVYFFDA